PGSSRSISDAVGAAFGLGAFAIGPTASLANAWVFPFSGSGSKWDWVPQFPSDPGSPTGATYGGSARERSASVPTIARQPMDHQRIVSAEAIGCFIYSAPALQFS